MDGIEYRLSQRTERYTCDPQLHGLKSVEKRIREEEDERNGVKKGQSRKRRKKTKKHEFADGESAPATPAESAKQMIKQRAFSKRIDYSAMDRLFADE